MGKKEVPILYIYFQVKLAERTNESKRINLSLAKALFANYKVPPILTIHILKEMEAYNLIKIIGKNGGVEICEVEYKIDKTQNGIVRDFVNKYGGIIK